MHPSQQDLEHAARTYRAAIDSAGPVPWKKQGRTFPRGACAHAAELLGRYLHHRLGINADYVAQNAEESLGRLEGRPCLA
jgi:hypothetical protein